MLANQKFNRVQQDELIQEHSTSKAIEETCILTMKDEWMEKSFKPRHQLVATAVYFLRKNLFREVNVELIAEEFKLKKQQIYKLVTGKKLKGGKVSK